MDKELKLRCRCGQVQGVAQFSPKSGTHIVCYCHDCQAFARQLQRADVLDAAGGTAIFQMAPAKLRITQGEAALRCLRLSSKGMHRWYTDCCRTPVGNTASGRIPFVGLILAFVDFEQAGLARDAIVGKPALLMGRSAIGGLPEHAHPTIPLRVLLRIASRLGAWWLTGQGTPSPFFDAQQQPRVKPYILTAEERASLRPAVVSTSNAVH